ncbi:DNA cytosine methyltransferase [Streptomyces lydicus]|uniref:DNA (cytosine-5-)-methyltransferase n=1 Tax=Streptomyces lydicus TaxID=47763 RepID=A0A1D7VHK3_9ACTN|nr:DNA cytosine methyltransferase [Streptomyces lydicus]AOP46234.1 hypothetical protein SL103_08290 [Streptomyces lydicus]
MTRFTSLELCAESGAQALDLERAGCDQAMLIDNNEFACRTTGLIRPGWDVRCRDLMSFVPLDEHEPDLRKVPDIALVSGGMPRIKAAAAVARRCGDDHERALLKAAVSVLIAAKPKALMPRSRPRRRLGQPRWWGSRADRQQEGMGGNRHRGGRSERHQPLGRPPAHRQAPAERTADAILQAIPENWQIYGRKTRTYRQIANLLPACAEALGRSIATALCGGTPSSIG